MHHTVQFVYLINSPSHDFRMEQFNDVISQENSGRVERNWRIGKHINLLKKTPHHSMEIFKVMSILRYAADFIYALEVMDHIDVNKNRKFHAFVSFPYARRFHREKSLVICVQNLVSVTLLTCVLLIHLSCQLSCCNCVISYRGLGTEPCYTLGRKTVFQF